MVRYRTPGQGDGEFVREARAMMRWSSIVLPVVAFVAFGFVLPVGVLAFLLAHYERPYGLDRAAMETPRSALGGNPVVVRPASGVFDVIADGGKTAVYADGSTATIVRTARPSQIIEKYGSSLNERRSRSSTAGGFTQRDGTLADGRVARTFGLDGTVFAFVAPSPRALDRLVAQSALRRNAKHDVGNTVLDGHSGAAILVGLGWFAIVSLLAIVAILRAVTSTGPSPQRLPWYQRPK
ncbi:MAG TPA: hypothetical protein VGC72_18095 [Candidatus Elarobacter sp.]